MTIPEELVKKLIYISETDAPIEVINLGKASGVSTAEVLRATGNGPKSIVETVEVTKFFDRLTTPRSWFGPKEIEMAKDFALLKHRLEKELTDIGVFRIGKIEIDIYVIGLDREGNLAGIKTRAIET